MTAIESVKKYLASLPEGQPFSSKILRPFATTENIRQILNRLVKAGELNRLAWGVFIKPKHIANLGELSPSASEIATTITKSTGETIAIHGAEAARQLQLTTQVPMRLIFYTSGNTRNFKIANRMIQLKHVNPSRLIAAGTIPGLVISALFYLGKENVKLSTLDFIKHQISSENFNATINLIAQMPTWMSDIFYHYKKSTAFDLRALF